MAKPEDLELVRLGKEEVDKWRLVNRNSGLDLSGADISGADLTGFDFLHADLTGANLSKTTITAARFDGAQLGGATFEEARSAASIKGARFDGAKMHDAKFCGATLWRPSFGDADLSHADMRGAILTEASFPRATLTDANFAGANLTGSQFADTRLDGANLSEARCDRAMFANVVLTNADCTGANFYEAACSGGEWGGVRGLPLAHNLEATSVPNEPKYIDHCKRSWLDRWCDWERLRTFGRMPLFGLSYSVLIFIPFYIYVIAWYNHQVTKLEGWQGPGGEWIGRHLHPLPLPSLSMLLLVSTILLAVASTLYALYCPARVKEFTRDVWCDQLNRPLLHYWPFAWRHRRIRRVCGICYVLGAVGVLSVLVVKVAKAGVYIWENTPGLL